MVIVCKNKLESVKKSCEKTQSPYKVLPVEDLESFLNADVDSLLPGKSEHIYEYIYVLPIDECKEILPVTQKEKVKEIISKAMKGK